MKKKKEINEQYNTKKNQKIKQFFEMKKAAFSIKMMITK